MITSVFLLLWLLGVVALVASPAALRRWIGPLRPLQLDADKLTWQMRHLEAGKSWGVAAWLVLLAPVSLPVTRFAGTSAAVLLSSLCLVAAALWLLRQLPREKSELRASTAGLVWNRRWPLQSRTWAWEELVSVKEKKKKLIIKTRAGERIRLPLLGVKRADRLAVVALIEATRTAPPPPPEPAPEIPPELRRLQQRSGT